MADQPTPTPAAAPAPTKAPGQPGFGARGGGPQQRRRPKSRYGTQMAEKQNFKSIFGIREEQLRKYYGHALRSKEETGRKLVALLESRLDSAVYRAGLAATRRQARQMVSHRLFVVNGRPVNIPSIQLKAGDEVRVREGKRGKSYFTNFEKKMQNVSTPSWLVLDTEHYGFRVQALPSSEEANLGVDVDAIVEFFAR